jgi:hypothetical protein
MKLSSLIKYLETILEKHGDVDLWNIDIEGFEFQFRFSANKRPETDSDAATITANTLRGGFDRLSAANLGHLYSSKVLLDALGAARAREQANQPPKDSQ